MRRADARARAPRPRPFRARAIVITESTMSIFWILFVGLVVGALARLLMPGRGPRGLLVTSLLGVLGAIVARGLGIAGGWYAHDQRAGLVASVLGAMLLLGLHRLWLRRRDERARRR